mgnify:CR=1 FL=1
MSIRKSDRIISVEHVSKYFGEKAVLNDVNLQVRKGEFVTILGPSGCGKTTLLRLIAGFQTASEGVITMSGKEITQTPPHKRPVNTVFQKYALFPHLNVYNNIAFGLKLKKLPSATIEKKVKQALKMVGLTDYEDRDVDSLSGGQQQRVAIARAIVNEPEVLLLDEPLAALDLKMRKDMQMELKEMHQKLGITFVYVTHDQMEAMTLATQICLMNNGVLQQYAAPLEVYNHPANLFAADFVGNPSINFVEAKGWQGPEGSIELTLLDGHKAVFTPEQPLQLPQWFHRRDEELEAQAQALKARAGESGYVEKSNKDETFRYHIARVNDEDDGIHEEPMLTNEDLVLGIRPEFLSITGGGNVECEIYGAMPTGMESTVKVRIGEYLLTGVVFGSTLFTIGSKHLLDITGSSVMLFDRSSGRRITSGTLKLL